MSLSPDWAYDRHMVGGVVPVSSAADMVRAVGEGDRRAFSVLYAAHVGAVRTVVRDNVHDRETVEDIVQEVFARALERLATLHDPDRFRPWLLSIARHAAIDERRQRKVTVDDGGPDALASPRPGPDEEAELSELCRLVNTRVAGLSRRDATALSLTLHLGYTPTQVAAVLHLTPGTAKVVLHRARLRLRDAVALEVLVHSQQANCPTFRALLDVGDMTVALQHIRRCALCLRTAGEEVQLYEFPPLTTQGPLPGSLDCEAR